MKITDKSMCEELGDNDRMEKYVMDYGKTYICSVDTKAGCSDREIKYIDKVKTSPPDWFLTEFVRLEDLGKQSMKPDLQQWVNARRRIVGQLVPSTDSSTDEL